MNDKKRWGDVSKLWLTTPTYNVYRRGGRYLWLPREGMPGESVSGDASESAYDFCAYLFSQIEERFLSGVIEFDTEDQIRFERTRYPGSKVIWKVRGTTYGGVWEDANEVDDATLVHRAIVVYQAYQMESPDE